MDGINYFMFKDVVEKETVRVQNDNPCAPDYIDSAWLGKDYVNLVQEELMEDCEDDCAEDGDASCENKCKQASRSGGSVSVRLTLLNGNHFNFSASSELKTVAHGDRRAQL